MFTIPFASRTRRASACRGALTAFACGCVLLSFPHVVLGQLTLDAARQAAHRASPELRAAREAVAAAAGRERQASAFLNPTLAYGRERTSRAGQTNAQSIAQLEQPLELGGQRAARRDAARLRREVAELGLAAARLQVDIDVARAFAVAIGADQRARLAERTASAFAEAQRVSEQRLVAGDISGYVARRLRLEAARFAALRAAAALERRAKRIALTSLMGVPASASDTLSLPDELPATAPALATLTLDSLLARAERERPEVLAAVLDAQVARAEALLATRDRIPTPSLTAGFKSERVADPSLGSISGFRGIVAGLSIPLPLLDRRAGAISAVEADARRVAAEGEALRRRVHLEVSDALDALRAAEAQRASLAPHLGADARIALQAVQTAYVEGEVTLVEWLDAVRAYQDAESTYLTLQSDVAIRTAALARAVGAPLFPYALPDR